MDPTPASVLVRRAQVIAVFEPEEIETEGGGQGGEHRVRAVESRRRQPQHEDHCRSRAEMLQRQRRKQLIGGRRNRHSPFLGVGEQQDAQRQEEQVHRHLHQRERIQVLLRSARGRTGEALLHVVLVKTSHHQGDGRPAQELLPEVSGRPPIPIENPGHLAFPDPCDHPARAQSEVVPDDHHAQHHPEYEKQALERIRPHQGPDAPLQRVGQHQQDDHAHGDEKRHAEALEHEFLKHVRRQIQSGRSPQHP